MKRFFLNRNNNYPLGNGREKVWKDGRGRKSQTHKRLWINYDLSQLGFLSIDFTSLRWTIFCSHFLHIFHLSLNRNPSVFCCEQEGKNSPKKKKKIEIKIQTQKVCFEEFVDPIDVNINTQHNYRLLVEHTHFFSVGFDVSILLITNSGRLKFQATLGTIRNNIHRRPHSTHLISVECWRHFQTNSKSMCPTQFW